VSDAAKAAEDAAEATRKLLDDIAGSMTDAEEALEKLRKALGDPDWNPEPGPSSGGGRVNINGPVVEEILDEMIDNIRIINGKVGGKIPVDEFKAIRKSSIKNPDADSMTLGRYTKDSDSYIARAGNNSSYFDLGEEWNLIKAKYGLSEREMFDCFNRPALDDAITGGKTIKFSHNPLEFRTGALYQEWEYIKQKMNLSDSDLVLRGGFFYVEF
jgi:hypothetical protein